MKKKILHILVLPKLAGSQRVSLDIFKGLPNDQFEKWVLFSDSTDIGDKELCRSEFENAGVTVIFSKKIRREIGFSDFAAICEIYRLCRREKFDIVHTHSTKPGIIGRIAATLAHIPLVVHTVHGLAFHNFVKFPKWQFYWVCEMFASLFCNKITIVNRYYTKYFRWCSFKVLTIYNGVDFSAYENITKQTEIDIPRVLFVGRLDIPKDPLTMLKAVRLVLQTHPETQFTLVGDGCQYSDCERFIRDNDMIGSVSLAGWQGNVAPYYASHDIFAMSSIYESFGLIFVEAAHYGLPSVATNVEGIPEVVLDNQTGLLCNPRDEKLLSQNIVRLIENPELRELLGKAAQKRAHEVFTKEKMVLQYINIYNNKWEK